MFLPQSEIAVGRKRLGVVVLPHKWNNKKWMAMCPELEIDVSGHSPHQALFNMQKAAEYLLASRNGTPMVYAPW